MEPGDARMRLHSYLNMSPSDLSSSSSSKSCEFDPLQSFLPSPFTQNSLHSLLVPSSRSYGVSPPLPPPFASTSSGLASASVPESIKPLKRPVENILSFFFQVNQGTRKRAGHHRQKLEISGLSLHGVRSLQQTSCPGKNFGDDAASDEVSEHRGKPDNSGGLSFLDTKKASKHLLAGALSTVISRTLVAPLERLKLEYLVRGATADVHHVVGKIYHNEGLKGFWKGNLMNLIRTAPFKSINFFTYDSIRNQITSVTGRRDITNFEKLAAGATAGILATIICFPLDTIRIRLVAPGGEAMGGIVGCVQHLISKQGFSSLYAGIVPALMSMAPAGAVFYGVYDILKSGYLASPAGQEALRRKAVDDKQQMDLDPWRTLLYGAIAGACAETVTYPLEVVRRRLQLQDAANRLNVLYTVKAIVEQGGIAALYTGLLPSTFQVLPSAALSYFIYEWLKTSLKVSQ